ncbi:MAG: chorismate mutase [Myxococcales bacterium]|nr:MAG: chorismate mutase [Myxococcales bacterium]
MPKKLSDLRVALDELDQKLLETLAKRELISVDVARIKSGGKQPLRDRVREQEIVDRLIEKGKREGLDASFVKRVYNEILDHSVRLQQSLLVNNPSSSTGRDGSRAVVAFRGGEASYTYLAAVRHFGVRGNDVSYEGFKTAQEVVSAVQSGDADYAVLPMENTAAGAFSDAYEVLEKTDLKIVGEELQRLDHCLITLENIPLHRIRRIYSPPQAFEHCRSFLSTMNDCRLEAYPDTALAVRRVRDDEDLSQAAIAGEEAAKLYGLPILKRDISDRKELFTRMVIVAKDEVRVETNVPCKTSVIFSTDHEEGALSKCLGVLAKYGCNLTKIESRPRPETPWEYLFYLDFEGGKDKHSVDDALQAMKKYTKKLKKLGSYPSQSRIDAEAVR